MVSWNRGTSKSSISMGFSLKTIHLRNPRYENPHIWLSWSIGSPKPTLSTRPGSVPMPTNRGRSLQSAMWLLKFIRKFIISSPKSISRYFKYFLNMSWRYISHDKSKAKLSDVLSSKYCFMLGSASINLEARSRRQHHNQSQTDRTTLIYI